MQEPATRRARGGHRHAVWVSALLLLSFGPARAASGEEPARIVDVRLAGHATFDRAVLELDREAAILRDEETPEGELRLDVQALPTRPDLLLEPWLRRIRRLHIATVDGGARVELSHAVGRVRVFRLERPARLVIDVADPGREPFRSPADAVAIEPGVPSAPPAEVLAETAPPAPAPAEAVPTAPAPEEAAPPAPVPPEVPPASVLTSPPRFPEEPVAEMPEVAGLEPPPATPPEMAPEPEVAEEAAAPLEPNAAPAEAPAPETAEEEAVPATPPALEPEAPVPPPRPAPEREPAGTRPVEPEGRPARPLARPTPWRAQLEGYLSMILWLAVPIVIGALFIALVAQRRSRRKTAPAPRPESLAEALPAPTPEPLTPERQLQASARLDLMEKRLDEEVRARMLIEERVVQLQQDLKVVRDRLNRALRREPPA